MKFETTERIIAIAPGDLMPIFGALAAQYAVDLEDGRNVVRTIGAHWDDAAKTRMRAASLAGGTIAPTHLADGRLAFRCLWQADLAAAFEAGEIEVVEELNDSEFNALLPPNEPTDH